MDGYHVTGNCVERVEWPRCRLVMIPHADGSWGCDNPEWLDDPQARGLAGVELAALCARVAREAGEAWLESRRGA